MTRGWALRQKVTGPSARRYTLSHRYSSQHALPHLHAQHSEIAIITEAVKAATAVENLDLPRSVGPGAVVHALELVARGELCLRIDSASEAGHDEPRLMTADGRQKRKASDAVAASIQAAAKRPSAHLLKLTLRPGRKDGDMGQLAQADGAHSHAGMRSVGNLPGAAVPQLSTIESIAASDELMGSTVSTRDASCADSYVPLSDDAAASALRECVQLEGGALAETLYTALHAAGPSGTPLLSLLSEHAAGLAASDERLPEAGVVHGHHMQHAQGVLETLQAMRRRSLAIRVCVGDERRYVCHSHVSYWATQPYELNDHVGNRGVRGGEDDSEPSGDDADDAMAPGGQHHDPSERKRRAEQKRAWVAQNVTPSGKRPRFDASTYYVPEIGVFSNTDTDVTAQLVRLRVAIAACVSANPGVSETQILARFWGHAGCQLKGALHAMVADGELRCRQLLQQPRGLFTAGALPATPARCYFLETNALALSK